MNLQDLRDELTTRAATADERPTDLLPGVHHKIRQIRRRRAATALGAVAAVAAVAIGVVPTLQTSTPDPADTTPHDYTKDGMTVPGVVGSDQLLKAWIGDRDQDTVSFPWTPETSSIAISASCSVGDGMKSVRISIGGWRVAEAGCVGGVEGWKSNLIQLTPDAAFWLDHPAGKPVTVSAEVIDMQSRKPGAQDAQIAVGIYSTELPGHDPDSGIPTRVVPPGPGDFSQTGVTYRAKVGGDTLAGASVGTTETRFTFTATGAPLVLHDFCTANRGSDSLPYQVSVQLGTGTPYTATCDASTTDAATRGSLTVPSPVPAGQRVDVAARIVPARAGVPAVPAGSRLGLGIYFQGAQRVVDGVSLPERTEFAGYEYRLADVKTATGPSGRVSISTPADQPHLVAYGSSPLGTSSKVEGILTIGKRDSGLGAEPGSGGALGIAWDGRGAGPAEHATLTVTQGKPTKGALILAIYLPA